MLALGAAPSSAGRRIAPPYCRFTSGSDFRRSPSLPSARSVFSVPAFRCRYACGTATPEQTPAVPPWTFAAAALLAGVLALVPAAAIVPKYYGDAVQLADPIFDHAKIAIIDAMARLGVPPVNPVFGEFGAPGRLAYYYLWHFSAAELALVARATGWEADIGLTWFTAFASLSLMMGLAVWLSKRSAAHLGRGARRRGLTLGHVVLDCRHRRSEAGAVAADRHGRLAVPGELGAPAFDVGVLRNVGDAASCPLCAAAKPDARPDARIGHCRRLRKLDLCRRRNLRHCRPLRRADPFRGNRAGAAPAFRRRIGARRPARDLPGYPVHSRSARGCARAQRRRPDRRFTLRGVRRIFSTRVYAACSTSPAIWLLIVPAELPAAFFAGVIGLFALWRSALPAAKKLAVMVLACLAGTGLAVSWLLVSTLGDNNDLGLRAIIPAVMVLIVGTAAAVGSTASAALARRRRRAGADRTRAQHCPTPHRCFATTPSACSGRAKGVRAVAAIMGGRAPLCDARRPDRQQSAIRQGCNAVADQHILGTARRPEFLLCRPRFGAGFRAAVRGTPRRRSANSFFACSRAKPRPTTCTTWRRNMAATSP